MPMRKLYIVTRTAAIDTDIDNRNGNDDDDDANAADDGIADSIDKYKEQNKNAKGEDDDDGMEDYVVDDDSSLFSGSPLQRRFHDVALRYCEKMMT